MILLTEYKLFSLVNYCFLYLISKEDYMKIEAAISDKYVRTNLGVPCFQPTNFIQKAANIYPSGGPEFVLVFVKFVFFIF